MTGTEEFVSGSIRLAAPLILAALGEVVVQRAGVINIGIEGMMLSGALAGVFASHYMQSAVIGVAAAALTGGVIGCIFSLLCIQAKSDQIVVGTGLNICLLGLTGFIFHTAFGYDAAITAPTVHDWSLPLVSRLPVVGSVLHAIFNQSSLAYFGLFVAIVIAWILRSPSGLTLKACGIYPEAADATGIRVNLVRFIAVVYGGIMAGIAGSYLSLVQTNTFAENMTSGRGFIALAVVIFGRWNPWGIVAAGLIFGAANSAQFWFQARGSQLVLLGHHISVPYQFYLAFPYILTLMALGFFAGQYRGPKALGQPYFRKS